jgi:diphthamide synthase (EF-2-diphthine--ammonia ligase)
VEKMGREGAAGLVGLSGEAVMARLVEAARRDEEALDACGERGEFHTMVRGGGW